MNTKAVLLSLSNERKSFILKGNLLTLNMSLKYITTSHSTPTNTKFRWCLFVTFAFRLFLKLSASFPTDFFISSKSDQTHYISCFRQFTDQSFLYFFLFLMRVQPTYCIDIEIEKSLQPLPIQVSLSRMYVNTILQNLYSQFRWIQFDLIDLIFRKVHKPKVNGCWTSLKIGTTSYELYRKWTLAVSMSFMVM